MIKFLALVLVAFFALNTASQSSSFPINDDEEYLADITDEPAKTVPGALCFHEESISVFDREMIQDYVNKTSGLEFSDSCIIGESQQGKYLPITVPESFLTIPGTYVDKYLGKENFTWSGSKIVLVSFIGILIIFLFVWIGGGGKFGKNA